MAHGGFSDNDDSEMLSEINMVPLIDVMLVLLIVFIITVPVMKHAVNIDLPRASNEKELVKPETVRLSVDADGAYFWNEQKLASDNELQGQLAAAAAQNHSPTCTSAGTAPCATSVWPRPWPPHSKPG